MSKRDDTSEYLLNEHKKIVAKLFLRAVYRKVKKDELLNKSDIMFILEEAVRVQKKMEADKLFENGEEF